MSKQRNYYQLNENENIIGSSDKKSIVFDKGGFILTNQRVIKVDRSNFGGSSMVHSINLEKIDSVMNVAQKHLILLIIGTVLIIMGLLVAKDPVVKEVGIFTLLIGIAFIGFFFFRRRRVIIISSGSADMIIQVHSMDHDSIQKLVFLIEKAKEDYLNNNNNNNTINISNNSTNNNIEVRLNKLKNLLEDKLITEAEYYKKKKEIISDL